MDPDGINTLDCSIAYRDGKNVLLPKNNQGYFFIIFMVFILAGNSEHDVHVGK